MNGAEADPKTAEWLMDHADTPVRYRTARELLGDLKTANKLEKELFEHPHVRLWLKNLKPQIPPQHRWMEHRSFDFCLENAMLKLVQFGLHGGLPQVMDAAGFYLAKMQNTAALTQKRRDFTAILTANLLSLAGLEDAATRRFMLHSLDEMHRFAQTKSYDLYYSDKERSRLAGIPACWKNRRHFIRQELYEEYGFIYPMIYDIAGLHSLYRLRDPEIDRRIDSVIRYLSTDAFHASVADGYGILVEGNGVYHSMGWDPKYPGWSDVARYLETGHVPRLLFFAMYASRYPSVWETKWYSALFRCLETYRTDEGRYLFPAKWLTETQGYAVMGQHLSFGENRRKKNWREIESTFYMLLLGQAQAIS